MKFNVQQFSQLIREIVRDEVKKALPGMVEKALTEQYIRRLVAEGASRSTARRAASVSMIENSFIKPDDEESIPEPMENTDQGIYHEDPLLKKTNEVKNALLSKNPALAAIYEGTQPLKHTENNAPAPGEVSEAALARLGLFDPNKNKKLMTSRSGESIAVDETRMQQLAEQRRRLEIPVGGGPARQQAAPPPRRAPAPPSPNPYFDADNAFAPVDWTPDQ